MTNRQRFITRHAGTFLICSSLLAAPAVSSAATNKTMQALEDSDIFVGGYAVAGYNGSFSNGQTLNAHVFDSNANSFELNQAALIVADTPDDGVGGKAVIVGGSDAKTLNAFYGSGSSDVAVFIAYAQYATGPLTVLAGRFPAMSGAELALAPLNTNISRSLVLALAQPVPLTGVRANYKFSESFTGTISVTNSDSFGSAAAIDDNKSKALELGGSFNPTKSFKLALYNYYAKESDANGGKNDYVDLVSSWMATDQLQLVANVDYKRVFNTTAGGPAGSTAGLAAYANYQFDSKWSSSLRVEALRLKNDATSSSTRLQEITLTGRYTVAHNFWLLGEFRYDHSSDSSFTFADGSHQSEASASAVYTFGL